MKAGDVLDKNQQTVRFTLEQKTLRQSESDEGSGAVFCFTTIINPANRVNRNKKSTLI